MFWKKKPAPAATPEGKSASTPVTPQSAAAAFPPGLKKEMARYLELNPPDALTTGIGMIKMGARELISGWFDLFGQGEIFAVSMTADDPETAFVFGPANDRNYLAVFTRKDLAQQCLQEFPQLKHIVSPLSGRQWLGLAQKIGRGLWINPLNDACSMQLAATEVAQLLKALGASPTAEPPVLGTPPPAEPPILNPAPAKPVRLAIGPSPWTWRDRSHVVLGKKYRFREHEFEGKPSAFIKILNEQDECLLLLGFNCYARILDDGTCLLWWKSKAGLEFRCFALCSLQAIADVDALVQVLRKQGEGVAGLPACDSFTFESAVLAGRHAVSAPPSFAKFEETLALGHFLPVNPQPGHQTHAIFGFNWLKGEVEVIPQDWFNKGSYDFDYMWIARVARLSDGKIVGDGVRLGRFELDTTGRQIGKWFEQANGYMLN